MKRLRFIPIVCAYAIIVLIIGGSFWVWEKSQATTYDAIRAYQPNSPGKWEFLESSPIENNTVAVKARVTYSNGGATMATYHLRYGKKGWYVESLTDVLVSCT